MTVNKFFKAIERSIIDLIKNFKLIMAGLILGVIIFLFSKFSYTINKTLVNTPTIIIWLVFSTLITLAAFSFFFSGMIGVSARIVKKEKVKFFKEFLFNSKRHFFNNLLILIIITLAGGIIWVIANYGVMYTGKYLNLELKSATILFMLIYFLFIISFLMFFTFSIFFTVLNDLNFSKSIKKSFNFVKRNYVETLSLNVLTFIIIGLFNKINNPLFDIFEYILLAPLFILIFSRFALIYEGKK